MRRWLFLIFLFAAPLACATPADLVLWHGVVFTGVAGAPSAQAVAVSGGRIIAVGRDADVGPLIGPGTKVIDLHGRAVTPGLIDTHAHMLETGLNNLFEVDLSGARRIADITGAVAQAAAKARPGAWIVGARWDEGKLAERRYPTAAELDAAAPGHPVWLENTTGHYGVASSAALALAHIDAKGPEVKAGVIERDADGRPTGVLKEMAQTLVIALEPPYDRAQREAAIKAMVEHLHAEGMIGVKDPAISAADFEAYRDLAARGELGARVCVLFDSWRTRESAAAILPVILSARASLKDLPDDDLKVCGAKIFLDGSGAAPTAWMREDWNQNRTGVRAGFKGFPQTDPDIFRDNVELFVSHGVGVGTHVIGDAAIDWAVDVFGETLARHPQTPVIMSFIHANTPSDHAIAGMAALQQRFGTGVPESQGEFAWWLGDIYAANLGPARSLRLNPFHTYEQQRIRWGGGSDSPVTPIDARLGLWASIARQTLLGTWGADPFGTAEAPSREADLLSYTAWAAPQIDAGGEAGQLAPGYSADLAVWEQDPLTAPTAALKDLVCDLTIFKGQVVFSRAGASSAGAPAPHGTRPGEE
jgi:predicted amidohydrolase YtcJ